MKYLLYPSHTSHTQHAAHCRHHCYRLIWRCAWILFVIKHPLCSASCCTVGSSNSVFISNGWTVLCGGEIQLLQTPCDFTATLSRVRPDLTHAYIFTASDWNTHISQKQPCLTWSRVYRLSNRSMWPVGSPVIRALTPVLIPQELNGVSVIRNELSIDLAQR